MPKFTQQNDLENYTLTTSNYGFSGVRISDDVLGSTEYTLVTIAVDDSGSISPFANDINKALIEVVKSCNKSPRHDTLMLRVVKFNNHMTELHGFKLLNQCDESEYNDFVRGSGNTSLIDTVVNVIEATNAYATQLQNHDIISNGLVVVITDGMDNNSTSSVQKIKQETENLIRNEILESCNTILVGVNTQIANLNSYLQDLKDQGGFTQYVDISNANESTIAKLADFISKSISAQSQSLGTGGPSLSLTF